jgi:isopenicillin N synthase-like dioxygenase
MHSVSYATAKRIEASEIPVIDIGPLAAGGDVQAVADRIFQAVTQVGFFYVTNHCVPQAAIDEARAAAVRFFALPMADKEKVRITRNHRGFLKMGGARMRDNPRSDYKESFVWGPEPTSGERRPSDGNPFLADNLWPGAPPGFREALTAFFDSAQDCAVALMRAFARAIDVPEDAFLKTADRPISRASVVYYPPQPASLGQAQFGVGPHTDFGCLTVLCQDEVGGLQVMNATGQWVTAHPIAGTLVVNVGDLLARWSNGRFRSTPHRVINSAGQARYSLILAYDPNAETVIDPADLLTAGETPRYPPTTCGAYIASRFDESFDHRK